MNAVRPYLAKGVAEIYRHHQPSHNDQSCQPGMLFWEEDGNFQGRREPAQWAATVSSRLKTAVSLHPQKCWQQL
ncbi:MAG: hypothetical protein H6657_08830 [Ardenticatenaceae bacterium]|nr:hypothetical protein [Ardenticatenaceae bacterium]